MREFPHRHFIGPVGQRIGHRFSSSDIARSSRAGFAILGAAFFTATLQDMLRFSLKITKLLWFSGTCNGNSDLKTYIVTLFPPLSPVFAGQACTLGRYMA
jgi:hypothetical protein